MVSINVGHSIEGRVPFLDHHVDEVIANFPFSQKIHGMTEKYAVGTPCLPDTVYDLMDLGPKRPVVEYF